MSREMNRRVIGGNEHGMGDGRHGVHFSHIDLCSRTNPYLALETTGGWRQALHAGVEGSEDVARIQP